MIKKAYKCALKDDQIEKMLELIKDNNNLIEIQLLSIYDDLSLLDNFKGRVSTIHLPLEKENRTCNLSTIIKAFDEENEKFDFFAKVTKYAVKENCGIVIHTDIDGRDLQKLHGYHKLVSWIKSTGVKLCLENTYEIKDAKKSLFSPLYVKNALNRDLLENTVYPLLDVCHYQVSYNQFDSNLKRNLSEIIDLYDSENLVIHLATAIGNGDDKNGGVHGSNFKENTELLLEILNKVKDLDPILVLETNETDMINKPNAVWLNNKINELLEGLI